MFKKQEGDRHAYALTTYLIELSATFGVGRLGKKRYIFPSQTFTAKMAFGVRFPPALDHHPVTQV